MSNTNRLATDSVIVKLALKRDNRVPMGQPAALHLDCPCGQTLPVISALITECPQCGARYDSAGWKLAAKGTV